MKRVWHLRRRAALWRRARQIVRDPDAVDVRGWPLEQAIAFCAALDRLDYYEAAWVEGRDTAAGPKGSGVPDR